MANRNRSRDERICAVLSIIEKEGSSRITSLFYGANLDSSKSLIKEMLEMSLIVKVKGNRYVVTKSGDDFLKVYYKLRELAPVES